ncbi:hypothetical protein AOQ84DRAFT_91058 [Glonium stellatum]|uniref:Uncharacterized protein n=1 Tax=Glonium stellatum TaxID=574774 RepID=A0A8E2JQE3_9PEZI|nr:hypothetical protein AOQ84DRAFT_91058 [Glonium stellatum]
MTKQQSFDGRWRGRLGLKAGLGLKWCDLSGLSELSGPNEASGLVVRLTAAISSSHRPDQAGEHGNTALTTRSTTVDARPVRTPSHSRHLASGLSRLGLELEVSYPPR